MGWGFFLCFIYLRTKIQLTMGKGDKRSRKGKIARGSYGVSRPGLSNRKNKKVAKPKPTKKAAAAPKAEAAPKKETATKAKKTTTKTAAKKTTTKSAASKKTSTTKRAAAKKK